MMVLELEASYPDKKTTGNYFLKLSKAIFYCKVFLSHKPPPFGPATTFLFIKS